ncbi:hypothetical protein FAF44_02615 [Nonomuraea sp. MG754425]|uniref:hypothetical protein n=1 Tax=Nonomuraea sp. MG754425 TaxID=2570319 RepID=UPI001F476445|nr:hypothetical protein [Nonomuraea sp. MG754425]MCF6467306.1 hypothetical protein [Nonomuraea sp. MG754425]
MARTDMTEEELAAWRARKDAGRARAYDAEVKTATLLRDHPEAIDGFRVFCARMGGFYSIRNCMRIYGQNPHVAHVQPRRFWGGYGFGREVIDPSAAIWILAPKVERKFVKEVENTQTGKTEEVEDSYRIWPIEDIYPSAATAPKDRPCVFCNGPAGDPCPDSCPIRQPQSGPPPTREDVAEAVAAVLKQLGGFDTTVLSTLGPDPMQDDYGDPYETPGVRWGTISVTTTATNQGGKPKKRSYRYLHTVDLDRPGVRYAIAGLGVVWISPYELRNDEGAGYAAVTVQYGDDVSAADRHWDSRYYPAGPHALILNGITFAGTSLVYPHEERWRWFSPHRAGYGGTVTEGAAEKMGQILRQLLPHYRGLVEIDAIEEAGFRKRAARRAREAEHEATRLAERERELADQRADAERRAAEHRHQAVNPNEL